jgi:N-formylglutamate deformylase
MDSSNMNTDLWKITTGNGPLVATAVHNGHQVRGEIADLLALDEHIRLREEDPFTGIWTAVADTQFIAFRSRFEIDLNRPREKAVYITPEDAWGLHVWKREPPLEIIQRSLDEYDKFYDEIKKILLELVSMFGHFIVFDLHSYNHRRNGPDENPSDAEENPDVNIGTGTMNRELWAPIVDRFINDLGSFDFLGRKLDVRENVRFRGGNFPRWIHETFPRNGCALAIEFKKFFMDEWTGKPYVLQIESITKALKSTVPGILDELEKI